MLVWRSICGGCARGLHVPRQGRDWLEWQADLVMWRVCLPPSVLEEPTSDSIPRPIHPTRLLVDALFSVPCPRKPRRAGAIGSLHLPVAVKSLPCTCPGRRVKECWHRITTEQFLQAILSLP